MQISDILQSFFRWFHILFGILWIGHLYFFNFVNSTVIPTLDAESKKKVVPQLMPRALWWFRWGAAGTWLTGLLLLLLVFYHGGLLFEETSAGWGMAPVVMLLVVFLSPFIYDLFVKKIKNPKVATVVGFVLIGVVVCLMSHWAGFSYRGYVIHTGTMFGTIMAFNVWFRIWPAQQKIITAVKNGEAPDASLVALAGLRSKQNTYLSVPLLWTMIDHHTTWAASSKWWLLGVILLGWYITNQLYRRATKVQGF